MLEVKKGAPRTSSKPVSSRVSSVLKMTAMNLPEMGIPKTSGALLARGVMNVPFNQDCSRGYEGLVKSTSISR